MASTMMREYVKKNMGGCNWNLTFISIYDKLVLPPDHNTNCNKIFWKSQAPLSMSIKLQFIKIPWGRTYAFKRRTPVSDCPKFQPY